jgi:hypothetical protein
MNFIFNDNVRILCLSCNVKKVGKLVRFKQKGEKQASFLAFHKCCQGCLLRGPRYVNVKDTFTSHIDKKIFLIFLLTPYLYTFSLYENPSFIIFSAETEYISTRSWYRKNCK